MLPLFTCIRCGWWICNCLTNNICFCICFNHRFIMKCLVLLAVCLGISSGWAVKENMDALEDPNWKAWKSFHNKSYNEEGEERLRNFIWQDNLKRIVSHNEVHKYKLAMNHLGDMVSFKTGRRPYKIKPYKILLCFCFRHYKK